MSWKNVAIAGAGLGGVLAGGLLVAVLGPRYEWVYETEHGRARLKAWTKADLEALKRQCSRDFGKLGGEL